MLPTKSLYLKLVAVLLTCCSFVAFGQTASEMKRAQIAKKQSLGQVESNSYKALQREVPLFQLIRQKSSGVVNAEFKEVQRAPLRGINTDKLDMSRQVPESILKEEKETVESEQVIVPSLSSLKGNSTFEFLDVTTGRAFQMTASKAEMAEFSRSVFRLPNVSNAVGEPVDRRTMLLEDQSKKSWSNADDSRTRRAIADGYSDTNSIYQRIANYGGCSANVISANSQRMVATTAAHCIFPTENSFSNSTIDPRRNGGASPTWGTWRPIGFGYYPSFIDNTCATDWGTGVSCMKHDIALVIAVPNSGAAAPMSMGWSYGSKSWLEERNKYRRGYPGCGLGHSPAGCTTNNLYGDGRFSIGSLWWPSAGWNRVMMVSTDLNPGDSGSGSYFYQDDHPYVFAVTSAEMSCAESCIWGHPNFLRRITPDFFDFISDVVH